MERSVETSPASPARQKNVAAVSALMITKHKTLSSLQCSSYRFTQLSIPLQWVVLYQSMVELNTNKCISVLTYATVILLHVVFELGSQMFESKSRFVFTEVRLDFSKISSITKY